MKLPPFFLPSACLPARLQEVHGSGDIPPDFADAARPDWVEAARWLERQRDLYRRQKLLLVRVRLLKQLLGEWGGVGVGAAAATSSDPYCEQRSRARLGREASERPAQWRRGGNGPSPPVEWLPASLSVAAWLLGWAVCRHQTGP